MFQGGSAPPLPARQESALHALRAGPKLQDLVRLRDLVVVPAGLHDPQLPVLFARNRDRDAVRRENRADRDRHWGASDLRRVGGWCQNVRLSPFWGWSFFGFTPPSNSHFLAPPLPKVSCKDVYSERIQRAGSVQVDLEVNEGEGGVLFRKERGVRCRHLSAHPPITTVPCSPFEADRADTSGALAVTCHVGRRGARGPPEPGRRDQ